MPWTSFSHFSDPYKNILFFNLSLLYLIPGPGGDGGNMDDGGDNDDDDDGSGSVDPDPEGYITCFMTVQICSSSTRTIYVLFS